MNDLLHEQIMRLLAHQGYALVRSSPASDDHAEMVLRRQSRTYLCHWHASPAAVVGTAPVQALCEAVGAPRIEGGLLVTRGRFEADAVALALNHPVELVDGETLDALVMPDPPERATGPACPLCGASTVRRGVRAASRSAPFWGCSRFPDCRGLLWDET